MHRLDTIHNVTDNRRTQHCNIAINATVSGGRLKTWQIRTHEQCLFARPTLNQLLQFPSINAKPLLDIAVVVDDNRSHSVVISFSRRAMSRFIVTVGHHPAGPSTIATFNSSALPFNCTKLRPLNFHCYVNILRGVVAAPTGRQPLTEHLHIVPRQKRGQ